MNTRDGRVVAWINQNISLLIVQCSYEWPGTKHNSEPIWPDKEGQKEETQVKESRCWHTSRTYTVLHGWRVINTWSHHSPCCLHPRDQHWKGLLQCCAQMRVRVHPAIASFHHCSQYISNTHQDTACSPTHLFICLPISLTDPKRSCLNPQLSFIDLLYNASQHLFMSSQVLSNRLQKGPCIEPDPTFLHVRRHPSKRQLKAVLVHNQGN